MLGKYNDLDLDFQYLYDSQMVCICNISIWVKEEIGGCQLCDIGEKINIQIE